MDLNTLHDILIALHAVAGVLGFIGGCVVISSRKNMSNRRLFLVYLAALVMMIVFLAVAMLVQWSSYITLQQVAFSGLFVLAIYMLTRAMKAYSLAQPDPANPDATNEYIHHIGFTLITLFEGFIIVTLLNLRASEWIVALVAIAGVLAGRRGIDIVSLRLDV